MSILTRTTLDAWQAHCHATLRDILKGALDLIDVARDPVVTPRKPSVTERESTVRAADDYQPTPRAFTRRTGRSDPVGRAVEAREAEIQRATTAVYAQVTATALMLGPLSLTVTDEHGEPMAPPDPPATREVKEGPNAGAMVVDADPARCRVAVIQATEWLGQAVDGLAGRCQVGEEDALVDRRDELKRSLWALARRVQGERPRLCACGCGEPAPPGKGATRPACRKRQQRERQGAA